MKTKLMLIIIIILTASGSVFAQSGTSLGLGNAYTTLARGSEAIFWNPANLAFREEGRPNFSFTMFSVGVNVANDAFSMSDYEDYFTEKDKYLTQEDRQHLVDRISDTGWEFDVNFDATVMAFAYKNFGLSFSSNAFATLNAPKDFVDIFFTGLEHREYNFSSSMDAEMIAKVNLAWGQVIARDKSLTLPLLNKTINMTEIAVGGTFSYNLGFTAIQTEEADITTIINNDGIRTQGQYTANAAGFIREFDPVEGKYETKVAEDGAIHGKGFGLNLATSVKTGSGYVFSVVAKNIINSTKWDKSILQINRTVDTGDPKFIIGTNALEDLDEDAVITDNDHVSDSFTTSRPFGFRIGVGKWRHRIKYAAEIGWEDEEFVYSFGGGLRWTILNLYAGYGFKYGQNLSGGIGIGGERMMFDVGLGTQDGITPGSTKGVLLASSFRFGW